MDLKRFGKSHTITEGVNKGVTFLMLPYRSMACDRAILDLNRMEPEVCFVNAKTGERTFDKPDALVKAEKRAEEHAKLQAIPSDAPAVPLTDWREEVQWGGTHTAFWRYLPITLDVQFTDPIVSVETQALAEFWQALPQLKDSADRWALFKSLIGSQTFVDWTAAYFATRDVPPEAAASSELGQEAPGVDDPKGDSGTPPDENISIP